MIEKPIKAPKRDVSVHFFENIEETGDRFVVGCVQPERPPIRREEADDRVRLRFQEKEWVFPREDCVLLPIENTTAELLARYLATRLRDELKTRHRFEPASSRSTAWLGWSKLPGSWKASQPPGAR